MKTKEIDLGAILEQLKARGVEGAEEIAESLRPAVSQLVTRGDRRAREGMRNAYREGFLTGRSCPRSMPYHSHLWTASALYRRMFGTQKRDAELDARYSRYND